MVDQEPIDLPNDSALTFDSSFYLVLQKIAADSRRRTLASIIPGFQTPLLQDVDGSNLHIFGLNELTTKQLNVIRSNTSTDINLQRTVHNTVATLLKIRGLGEPSTLSPDGHLYGGIALQSMDKTDGAEMGEWLIQLTKSGVLQNVISIKADSSVILIDGDYNIDLNDNEILNALKLNTHVIPGGTDIFAMLAAAQVLSNKTLDLPTIASFINAIHNHQDAVGGGQLDIAALSATGVRDSTTFLRGDGKFDVPVGTGEINTVSNVGVGQLIFKQKVGVNLEFKTLLGRNNIVVHADDPDQLEIELNEASLDTVEFTANKNAINGYAGLNGSSKLTGSQQVYGATSDTAAEGNDTRLSDDRTPLAHSTTHKSGGSDAIKLDELATPDDNTALDATTLLHGLLSKLDKIKLDNLTIPFTWAVGDEDSPLPSGAFPVLYITEPSDKERTITDVIMGLKNTATGTQPIAVEIQKETGVNTNLFTLSALVEIDVGDFTSTTSSNPRIITVPSWERGRRLKFILIDNDTNAAATGLKVTVVA